MSNRKRSNNGSKTSIRSKSGSKKEMLRADAAFAKPEIYEALEARGLKSGIRLPANGSLERDFVDLFTRPVDRPHQRNTRSGCLGA